MAPEENPQLCLSGDLVGTEAPKVSGKNSDIDRSPAFSPPFKPGAGSFGRRSYVGIETLYATFNLNEENKFMTAVNSLETIEEADTYYEGTLGIVITGFGITNGDPEYTCKIAVSYKKIKVKVNLTYFWGVADITQNVNEYFCLCSGTSRSTGSTSPMPTAITAADGLAVFCFKKQAKYAKNDSPENGTFKIMVSSPRAANAAVTQPF